MVLLNALIAVMSDAAASAADKDGTKFLGSRAEIIDELEQSVPSWHRQAEWCAARLSPSVDFSTPCAMTACSAQTTVTTF